MIRNLKYNGGIVEQPIHEGVPLTRWIHDGVVVWENGGFTNLIFTDFPQIACLNITDKKAYVYFNDNLHHVGLLKDMLVAISNSIVYTNRYYVTSDYKWATFNEKYSDNKYSDFSIADKNTLIGIVNNSYEITKITIKNREIEKEETLTSVDMTNYTGLKPYKCCKIPTGNPLIFSIKTKEVLDSNFDNFYYCLFAIDKDGNEILFKETVFKTQVGYASNIVGTIIDINYTKRFDVNGTTYVMCAYSSKTTLNTDPLTNYFAFARYKNGLSEFIIRETNDSYDMANYVVGLKYIKSTDQYFLYYANSAKTLLVHESNEDLDMLDRIDSLPDYLDIPIENGIGKDYQYIRVWINPYGKITEEGYYLYSASDTLGQSVKYDNTGKLMESDSIDWYFTYGYDTQNTTIFVHIDNVLFAESEDNYATYLE